MKTQLRHKTPSSHKKSTKINKKSSRTIKTRKAITRTAPLPTLFSQFSSFNAHQQAHFSTEPNNTKNTPNETVSPSKNTQKAQNKTTSADTPTNKYTERIVFESPLSPAERFLSVTLLALPTYTSLQCVTATLLAPEISILMPAAICLAATGMAAYRWRSAQHRVTDIRVTGPDDPVTVSVPTIYGSTKKKVIQRSDFYGVPDFISTKQFIDSKIPFMLFAKGHKTFFLKRDGLFDSSGILDSILGYDVITFNRCPPSKPFNSVKVRELARRAAAIRNGEPPEKSDV